MDGLLKGMFGGPASTSVVVPAEDADFADFAGAPEPTPASITGVAPSGASSFSAFPTAGITGRPYTKWYRVWERTTISDFYQEMFVIPVVFIVVIVHLWGTRTNRRKAKSWVTANLPTLQQEFAIVGFTGKKHLSIDDVQSEGLAKAMANQQQNVKVEDLLKEKKSDEYATYATGRQNVAFMDVRFSFAKRYNPLARLMENLLSFFFESMPAPEDKVEATIYPFDGREVQLLVPGGDSGEKARDIKKSAGNSTYDGFVWAIVHKDLMKRLREERYDLSLTTTKDHAKLPVWVTVMSEGSEITETLLTPDIIKAVESAGDDFEALVVSDMPMDQPKKLDELVPKKRITLSLHNSGSNDASVPLVSAFVRFADHLAVNGHFRSEALRRVKQTREEEIKKIRKVDEDEKAEDRRLKVDKEKKEKREAALRGLSADEQRKYLDKERERETRKKQKKQTVKG